ncbi:YopX family protein [Oceanobacillus oncorhynchi]|uniref:YopX family protein n=1 Tax=Oceanobacillus oncorhynchi TaxID=545501 RepID=UPI002F96C34E
MREIKFKIYDTDLERMYHLLENRCSFGTSEENRAVSWEDVFAERYDCLIPLQYTGLKDKNGKEIFEGDIISTDLSRPYLIVEFRNGGFMYQCHDSGEDYYDFMLPPADDVIEQDHWGEIIGNIYENPELLEG